jgi:DUF971 family protein
MSPAAAPRPVNVTPFPNGELGILWEDGHESIYGGHALRCACGCASCVDEVTGRKMLRDDRVPATVRVLEIHRVGRYAVSFVWSDGHETGIYSFETLRSLCPCEICSAR